MCDKTVTTRISTIQSILQCYKTQKMCDKAVNKAVNRRFLYLFLFPNGIKLKKCVAELFLKILLS